MDFHWEGLCWFLGDEEMIYWIITWWTVGMAADLFLMVKAGMEVKVKNLLHMTVSACLGPIVWLGILYCLYSEKIVIPGRKAK